VRMDEGSEATVGTARFGGPKKAETGNGGRGGGFRQIGKEKGDALWKIQFRAAATLEMRGRAIGVIGLVRKNKSWPITSWRGMGRVR